MEGPRAGLPPATSCKTKAKTILSFADVRTACNELFIKDLTPLLKSQLEWFKATLGSSQGRILIVMNLPVEKSSGNGRVDLFIGY